MPEQSLHDENIAPNQHDYKVPKPISEEAPMTTPPQSVRTIHAEYPTDGEIPKQTKRDVIAAGFHAIKETFVHAIRESTTRNAIALTVVNHKGGFDCPSCAWPDPDGSRHPAEFCENGAKAIAWEATNRKVEPEFFAKHSIDDLASHTE